MSSVLGPQNMIEEQSETWQEIMNSFRRHRRHFNGHPVRFDLPDPLWNLSKEETVLEGEVRISVWVAVILWSTSRILLIASSDEMKSFFAPVENSIREAIDTNLYEASTMDCEIKVWISHAYLRLLMLTSIDNYRDGLVCRMSIPFGAPQRRCLQPRHWTFDAGQGVHLPHQP